LLQLAAADEALRWRATLLVAIVAAAAMVVYVVVALAALDLLLPKLALIGVVLLISVPVLVAALYAASGAAARRIAELRGLARSGALVRAVRVAEDWDSDVDDERHWTATYQYEVRGEPQSFALRSSWTATKVFHPRAIFLLVDPASGAEPHPLGTAGEPVAATVVRIAARLVVPAALGVCALVTLSGTPNWAAFAVLVSFVVFPLIWIVTAIRGRLLRRIDERGGPAR
jgi:hypothetical protein